MLRQNPSSIYKVEEGQGQAFIQTGTIKYNSVIDTSPVGTLGTMQTKALDIIDAYFVTL